MTSKFHVPCQLMSHVTHNIEALKLRELFIVFITQFIIHLLQHSHVLSPQRGVWGKKKKKLKITELSQHNNSNCAEGKKHVGRFKQMLSPLIPFRSTAQDRFHAKAYNLTNIFLQS